MPKLIKSMPKRIETALRAKKVVLDSKNEKTCLKMQGQKTAPISDHSIYFINPSVLNQMTCFKIYTEDIMSYIYV